MKKRLLLVGLWGLLVACGQENEPMPATLADQLSGTYQTNGFLDILCIALPPDKTPVVEVKAESDSKLTLTLRRFSPTAEARVVKNISLQLQADYSIGLFHQGEQIGSFQTDRVFTSSGMETQGKVLRISKVAEDPREGLYFTGYRR